MEVERVFIERLLKKCSVLVDYFIFEWAADNDMEAMILPKKDRKIRSKYDEELYKWRYLVENVFLHLKRWCGIAT